MEWMDKLERKFGAFAIPFLPMILVVGQALGYIALNSGKPIDKLMLIPYNVMHGEFYRLFSFIFFPAPMGGLIGFVFFVLIFFMIASTLENQWGVFRFNLFIFTGWLATVLMAFVSMIPALEIAQIPWFNTGLFLEGSVFLAFAWLFPNFEFLLFFVLPVKVKWLGIFAAAMYLFTFIDGSLPQRLQITAGLANFFIFFGPEFKARIVAYKRRQKFKHDTQQNEENRPWDDDEDDEDEDD
jgi:hypothetical protein